MFTLRIHILDTSQPPVAGGDATSGTKSSGPGSGGGGSNPKYKKNLFSPTELKGVVHLFRNLPSFSSTSANATMTLFNVATRTTLVFVAAVPNYLSPEEFIAFCGSHVDHFSDLYFIRNDAVEDRYSVLIKIVDKMSADGFCCTYKGKRFKPSEPEVCHIYFAQLVEYTDSAEVARIPPPGYIELPTCPVCLERLDHDTSAIQITQRDHSFQCSCISKWTYLSCQVCRLCQQQDGKPICVVCGTSSNPWVCLICGFVGCGRYEKGHAIEHFGYAQHCYSLQPETQQIWDYVGNKFVHRLNQSETGSKSIVTNHQCVSLEEEFCGDKEDDEVGGALFSSKVDTFIRLDFMVEKKSNRVLFAESNKDFIDILFSFLTLPIGSIVKMTKELSHATPIGCMNSIHKSVENLETKFFMTEACKDLLLSPGRSSEPEYNNLKLKNGDDLESAKLFYFCANSDCRKITKRLSEFPNVHCDCGQLMTRSAKKNIILEEHGDINGVFFMGVTDMFLISDDLQVMAGSSSQCLSLMKSSGITDAKELETESITIRSHEVLQLLHLTMVSKTPLTDLIGLKKHDFNAPKLHLENAITELPVTNSDRSKSKLISLKLFISKSKEKVLYAECGEDFVDFLFSFLTFPLGSIVKLLDGSSSVIAIDNVYRSVKDLDSEHYIKSDQIKNMLINPNLSPFHGCENQLLDFEEASFPLYELNFLDSKTEWSVCPVTKTKSDTPNSHPGDLGLFSVVNPKDPNGGTSSGGGFIKGPSKFMVTDELDIIQLSAISSVLILAKLNVLISDVDTLVIDVGKEEALSLLKAALVSETPLSDLYKQKWKKVSEEVFDSGT